MRLLHVFSSVVMTGAIVLMANTGSAQESAEFRITFEWSSQPTLTIRRAAMQDSVVLSIDFERFPLHRVPTMLSVITEQGAADVAQMTILNRDGEYAAINFTLQPMARSAIGEAAEHLHKALEFREINLDASLSTLSSAQIIDLLRPAESSPDSERLRNDFNKAIEGALPNEADERGWGIEIQGYHYYGKEAK